MRLTENDKTLSKYFAEKINKSETIPFMTEIQKDTGVSIATISRYAKRKGYYNFSELRAKINQGDAEDKIAHSVIVKTFIDKWINERFVVATSVSCQSIGYHIAKRLTDINIPCRFIDHKLLNKEDAMNTIKSGEKVIFITISGESAWFETLEKVVKNETLVVSMKPLDHLPKNYTNINLPINGEFNSIFDRYKSVRKLFLWADEILNIMTIERRKK